MKLRQSHFLKAFVFVIPSEFITGLLQNIGTHVDPIKLIQVRYVCELISMVTNKGFYAAAIASWVVVVFVVCCVT